MSPPRPNHLLLLVRMILRLWFRLIEKDLERKETARDIQVAEKPQVIDNWRIFMNKKKLALTSGKPQAATQAKYAFVPPAPYLPVIGNFKTHYFTSLYIQQRNKTLLRGFIRATIIRLSNVEVDVHSKVHLVSNSSSRLSADAWKAEKRKCKRSGALEQYLHQAVISIEVQP